MARFTDDQLRKYAAEIFAGLKNVNFTPEEVAGVMAWAMGLVYVEAATGLTKAQFLANVVTTVDKCIEARGDAPKIIRV
jgi:hypothetical protein